MVWKIICILDFMLQYHLIDGTAHISNLYFVSAFSNKKCNDKNITYLSPRDISHWTYQFSSDHWIKQCRARLVLGWVNTWGHWVLLALLFLKSFFPKYRLYHCTPPWIYYFSIQEISISGKVYLYTWFSVITSFDRWHYTYF